MAAPAHAGERQKRVGPPPAVVETKLPPAAGTNAAAEPHASEPPAPEPVAPEPAAPEPVAPEPPAPEPEPILAPELPALEPEPILAPVEDASVEDAVASVELETDMATTPLAVRREPVATAPTRPAPIAAAPAATPETDAGTAEVIDYLEVASIAPVMSMGSLGRFTPALRPADGSVTLVQSAVGPRVVATEEYAARALAGSLLPARATGAWSAIGAAAARFGPWLALLLIALIIHGVARSALADKLRGTRGLEGASRA
jgi:hypothetical protein